jgi:hypothetical protein
MGYSDQEVHCIVGGRPLDVLSLTRNAHAFGMSDRNLLRQQRTGEFCSND